MGPVLVATDGSDAAEDAVDWAAQQADARHTNLLILTAVEGPPYAVLCDSAAEFGAGATLTRMKDNAERRERDAVELTNIATSRVAGNYPDLPIGTTTFSGTPREALQKYAHGAGLVVIGSRGLGALRSPLLGSLGLWATRHLDVPLAVVRPVDSGHKENARNVAVAVASDGDSEQTLREAFADAARRGLKVTAANCRWDAVTETHSRPWTPSGVVDSEVRAAVTAAVEKVAIEYPNVEHEVVFVRGLVDRFLVDLAARHDVLVIGRRDSSGDGFFGLGTVAGSVVEHARSVVLVVPFTSPDARSQAAR